MFSILHMSFIKFIVFQMKIALTLFFPSTVIFFFFMIFHICYFLPSCLCELLNFTKIAFSFQVSCQACLDFFFFFSFIMYAFNWIKMSQDRILLHFSFNSYKIMKFDFDFSLVHMLFRNRLLNIKPDKDFQNFGYWLLIR